MLHAVYDVDLWCSRQLFRSYGNCGKVTYGLTMRNKYKLKVSLAVNQNNHLTKRKRSKTFETVIIPDPFKNPRPFTKWPQSFRILCFLMSPESALI